MRKFNGLVRYSQGTADNGFSILGMGYTNRWTSTDQVAAARHRQGLIGRFGSLDPTDGGEVHRLSLSGRWSRTETTTAQTRAEAYVIHQTR